MMKALFFTTGPEIMASSRTRVYQYLPHLERQGIKTKVINYVSLSRCRRNLALSNKNFLGKIADKVYAWTQTIRVIFDAPFYDVVFLQKVLLPIGVLWLLKRLNANIIFDFDDATYLADRFEKQFRLFGRNIFLKRFNNTLRVARCIIVENEYNKAYAERINPNVVIITGPIDTLRYAPRRKTNSEDTIIGWIGSPETTAYTRSLDSVFKTLSVKYKDLKIMLVGASHFSVEGTDIVFKEWGFLSEVEDLNKFDIGIMPLEDNEWTRGKGGYKLLQYMAVGIPCVASPVGVNRTIIDNGKTGFHASSENEWLEKLDLLISDAGLRHQMGKAGRLRAEKLFSYEASMPSFLDVLRRASAIP